MSTTLFFLRYVSRKSLEGYLQPRQPTKRAGVQRDDIIKLESQEEVMMLKINFCVPRYNQTKATEGN
jgi:hypothetical protein